MCCSHKSEFKRPVYAGEQITCNWLIADIDERGHAKSRSQDIQRTGVTVLEATATGVLPGTEERECLQQVLAEGDLTNGVAVPRT